MKMRRFSVKLVSKQSGQKKTLSYERGSVMVESVFGILLFTIVFLFMLFLYEVIETKIDVQIQSGKLLRQEMIAKQHKCYDIATAEISKPVNLQYNIKKFVGVNEVPIEVSKIAYVGSCSGLRMSRFDNIGDRHTRAPDGTVIGDW